MSWLQFLLGGIFAFVLPSIAAYAAGVRDEADMTRWLASKPLPTLFTLHSVQSAGLAMVLYGAFVA